MDYSTRVDYVLSLLTLVKQVGKLKLKTVSDPPPRGRMDWVEHQKPGTRLWPVRHKVRSDDGRSNKPTGEFSWDAATRQSGYDMDASNTSLNWQCRILCHGEPTGVSVERTRYKRRVATGAALTLKQNYALMRCFRVRRSVGKGRYRSVKGLVTRMWN